MASFVIMSQYLLTTLHQSHCLRDGFVLAVSLQAQMVVQTLVLVQNGNVEVWSLDSSATLRLLQLKINLAPTHSIAVPSALGKEDAILFISSEDVYLANISDSKLRFLGTYRLPAKRVLDSYDILLLPDKATNSRKHLFLGDNTSQVSIISIKETPDGFMLENQFRIFLEFHVFGFFTVSSLLRETSPYVGVGLLTGPNDQATGINLIEVDIDRKFVVGNPIELREVTLKTRDCGETFSEKVWRIFDLGNKCILVFSSHSIKLFRVKDSQFQKVVTDRFKLPQSDQLLVERAPQSSSSSSVFYMANHVQAANTTYLYVLEVPSNANFENMSMTYIGNCATLSKPPVCLPEKRLLLLSKIEDSEIVGLSETKTGSPQRPFLRQQHIFENFGIIQQLDIDPIRKSTFINSYKTGRSLQVFQKGVHLELQNKANLDLTHLVKVDICETTQSGYILGFSYPDSGVLAILNQDNTLLTLEHSELSPILCLGKFNEQFHVVVTEEETILVQIAGWQVKSKVDESLVSAAYHQGHLFGVSTTALVHLKVKEKSISLKFRKPLESEPREVHYDSDHIYISYWIASHIDVMGLDGSSIRQVVLDSPPLSLLPLNGKLLSAFADGQVVISTENGENVVLQAGTGPMCLRKISSTHVVAVGVESALIDLSHQQPEATPICQTDLVDMQPLNIDNRRVFLMVTRDCLSFAIQGGSVDAHRVKELKLHGDKLTDRFVRHGNLIITAHTENTNSILTVSSYPEGTNISKIQVSGQVETLLTTEFNETSLLLVGTSIGIPGIFDDPMTNDVGTGTIKVFAIKGKELSEIQELQQDKCVKFLSHLEGQNTILATIGLSTLKVLRFESRPRKADKSGDHPAPLLKEVYNQKLQCLIDQVKVLGNYILVTDYYWSAQLYLFDSSRFMRFKSLGRYTIMNSEIFCAELISPTRFIVSDKANNLLVCSLPESGASDTDFIEFTDNQAIGLQSQFLCSVRGSKPLTSLPDSFGLSGSAKFVVLGGIDGCLYVLWEIPRKVFNLLEELQKILIAQSEAEGGPSRREYRRITTKNKKTKPFTGIVDGQVLEPLISLEDSAAHEILSRVTSIPHQNLTDIRSLLRFYFGNPAAHATIF